MREEFEQSGPSYTTNGGGESTSIAHSSCFALSGHLFDYSDGTTAILCCNTRQSSSTYARQTQMGHERGIGAIRAYLHNKWWRRVDLYSSKLLLCLIRPPLRLQRQYHGDPLLLHTSIVVYIYTPNANEA